MHRCPVCSEELYEHRDEKIVAEYRGKTYHFCSDEHREEFRERPGTFRREQDAD